MTATRIADPPPATAFWLLGLRFVLEIGSLFALGAGARHVLGRGAVGWGAATVVPLVVAAAWGLFSVAGDTRGSGAAPIPVPGWVRVAIETTVLGAGAAALVAMGRWTWGGTFVAALVVDHWGMRARIRWLLRQK
jgi:Protein of unknown function (DUF2568)